MGTDFVGRIAGLDSGMLDGLYPFTSLDFVSGLEEILAILCEDLEAAFLALRKP